MGSTAPDTAALLSHKSQMCSQMAASLIMTRSFPCLAVQVYMRARPAPVAQLSDVPSADLAGLLTIGQLLSPEDSSEGSSILRRCQLDCSYAAAPQASLCDKKPRSQRAIRAGLFISPTGSKSPGLTAVHLAAHAGTHSRAHSGISSDIAGRAASSPVSSNHSPGQPVAVVPRRADMSSNFFSGMRLPSLTKLLQPKHAKTGSGAHGEAASGRVLPNLLSGIPLASDSSASHAVKPAATL